MSLLFRILYAAHANGTHHKLALDALRHLASPNAEAWRTVFLSQAELYLEGSKAPDTEFKDFKNHVLHVRDGYWGGAPEKVQNWYGHLVAALKAGDWAEAAYAGGVLSHYYTDPIHPFHTAQSEAENNIHRAAEWSINRSYDSLLREAELRATAQMVTVPTGPHWLKDLVCRGADTSNQLYEKLIAHYDIHRGVTDPPSGLDKISRQVAGDLIVYASRTFAVVLDRAIAQSGATAPEISLTAATVLAALKIPLKFVQKKLADAADRDQVQRMYDELMATGRVEANLPADDRMVRDLHRAEILEPRAAVEAVERKRRLQERLQRAAPPQPATPPPALLVQPPSRQSVPTIVQRAEPVPQIPAPPPSPVVALAHAPVAAKRPARATLALSDDVEAAPSIGPKMAERLALGSIKSIADLLNADPDAVALKLGDRRITTDTVHAWQDQTRLVLSIPGLRGGHAQLLVGAGYRDAAAIRDASPGTLCADILRFATTPEGQRVLRDGDVPDIERIKGWIDDAVAALAA